MAVFHEHTALAPLTTIGLGGNAKLFVECNTLPDIQEALALARRDKLPVHVLGGGSNTIFADEGFNGVVIAVRLRGVTFLEDGVVDVAAGEVWDDVVQQVIARSLAGIECLSGIPGLVGATPMQNVGAYGQDVSEVIESVTAIEQGTGEEVQFSREECEFSYRGSRFKAKDAGRYIITSVRFRLRPNATPTLRYPQLAERLRAASNEEPTLTQVRQAVLELRASKSMVVDSSDPNTKSCGSFFVNPVISNEHLATLQQTYPDMPFFSGEETPELTAAAEWTKHGVKIPAAWLVEQAGFSKGMVQDGVGISANHPLALININGTTQKLLALARNIRTTVQEQFGIKLEQEPIVIGPAGKVQ